MKPGLQRDPDPKYAIYSGGEDTNLVIGAPDPDTAIRLAHRFYPSDMLGWPDPLTARVVRDEKGGATKPKPGLKYRIYSDGKDRHLQVTASDAEGAIKKARQLFPRFMLGEGPLTARLTSEKGGGTQMTRTEQAQIIRWLRVRRDSWRVIARRPANVHNAYALNRIADAFQEAAQHLNYQLTSPFGPLPRFPALH